MYKISSDIDLHNIQENSGDFLEELIFDESFYHETMNDWLANMKRW